VALWDEGLARDRLHRLQHALVANPAPAKLPLDHLGALGGELGLGWRPARQKM
jgi:hypothetical protein